jgi:hypothetical protein
MQRHASLQDFLARARPVLSRGPLALVFAEDGVELGSTVRHALMSGFRAVLVFSPPAFPDPGEDDAALHRIDWDTMAGGAVPAAVNAVAAACPPSTWLHWCYNAEYLFFPFCETRNVRELIAFHAEERRDAMLTYVIDLYAPDLTRFRNAVSPEEAMFDRTGYYALARTDPARGHAPKERQLDFFGGLRWRFEEHVPYARRRIDRIGLFRAVPGVRLRDDFTLTVEEMNTYACPWHHNLTAAIASFRTAKALKSNPGSDAAIGTFVWQGSVKFDWSSRQLMDLGLMEPGQWF